MVPQSVEEFEDWQDAVEEMVGRLGKLRDALAVPAERTRQAPEEGSYLMVWA